MRTELGCIGHFIMAKHCLFRRHTQIDGNDRVSTVGNLFVGEKSERQTIGAGDNSFFETYVFKTNGKRVKGSENCGCFEVADWCEIDGSRWATAGDAQSGHEMFVRKYMEKSE